MLQAAVTGLLQAAVTGLLQAVAAGLFQMAAMGFIADDSIPVPAAGFAHAALIMAGLAQALAPLNKAGLYAILNAGFIRGFKFIPWLSAGLKAYTTVLPWGLGLNATGNALAADRNPWAKATDWLGLSDWMYKESTSLLIFL
ncbi:MAG: hypothetical protein AB1374_12895 [Bacillota bacterium]